MTVPSRAVAALEEPHLAAEVVLPELLPVVRGEDDQRLLPLPKLL
jgi:hypothetical protein